MAKQEVENRVTEEVAGTKPAVPFELKFDDEHESVSITVPVSDRLKVGLEFNQLFPSWLPLLNKESFDPERRLQYMEGIAGYLDAVLRITPESQEAYRQCLDDKADGFSFTKGDFIYVYNKHKAHSFTRYTADDSGIILVQGFELDDDGIFASAALAVNGDLIYGSGSCNNPSAINFIEDVVSELSPGIVTGFNNIGWYANPISQWDLSNQRNEFKKARLGNQSSK